MQENNHRLLQCALEMLNFVADSPQPVSFKELCDAFDLPKSTIHKLAQTMFNMAYLQKNQDNGRYTIGIRCFQTGDAFRQNNLFNNMAKEIVERLSVENNETTHFAVLEGTEVIYIYKFDSNQSIRVYSQVGKKIPAHATAIGKALLSGYSDDELRNLYPGGELPAMTNKSITSVEGLITQLREVRRTSLAYEFEESSPYVKCIAVPVLNRRGTPVAGVSFALPVYREENNAQSLEHSLLAAKAELEALHALYEL